MYIHIKKQKYVLFVLVMLNKNFKFNLLKEFDNGKKKYILKIDINFYVSFSFKLEISCSNLLILFKLFDIIFFV